MATLKIETFSQAGHPVLNTVSGWTGISGRNSPQVYSSNGTLRGASDGWSCLWTDDLPGAAQYVQCVATTVTADSYMGLLLRGTTASVTGLAVEWQGTAGYCRRYDSGTMANEIGTFTAPTSGQTIYMEVTAGNYVTVKVNGATVVNSVLDSSIPASGYGGVQGYASSSHEIDNWEVGNLDTGVSLPLFVNANQPTL